MVCFISGEISLLLFWHASEYQKILHMFQLLKESSEIGKLKFRNVI